MSESISIIGTWDIANRWGYFFAILGASITIRAILSLLQGIDNHSWKAAKCAFKGYPNDVFKKCGDGWQAFALGTIELAAFPILMKTGNWAFIGAWLVFKTLGHWKVWKEDRRIANRFLVGVALVLITSVLCLTQFVILL